MGYSDYRECVECSHMAPELAPCEKCGKEICDGCEYPCSICDDHATCEACTTFCDHCGDAVCADCQIECPICLNILCEACLRECVICGEKGCLKYYISCDDCQGAVCNKDHLECANCGTQRCWQCVAVPGDCCDGLYCDDCHFNEDGVCIRQPE